MKLNKGDVATITLECFYFVKHSPPVFTFTFFFLQHRTDTSLRNVSVRQQTVKGNLNKRPVCLRHHLEEKKQPFSSPWAEMWYWFTYHSTLFMHKDFYTLPVWFKQKKKKKDQQKCWAALKVESRKISTAELSSLKLSSPCCCGREIQHLISEVEIISGPVSGFVWFFFTEVNVPI